MNILIDIGHPAHVHNFRNLYHEIKGRHRVTVTCKSIPIITRLLEAYEIPFLELGEKGSGLTGKFIKQLSFNRKIRNIIRSHKIALAMGLSFSVIYASKFTNAISLMFDDDDQEPQPLTAKLASPYADMIMSPDVLSFENLKNALYYPGYHELAYLHPRVFKPDPTVLNKYGIIEGEKYFILRFSAFMAHHDVGAKGINNTQKHALVDLLSQYGRVFITMEAEIEHEFESYKMPIQPHEIHDFLHFSQMLVCDGQTMCTEAALLGVPSLRCNSFAGRVAVLDEEEKKYGLTYAYLPHQFDWLISKMKELLEWNDIKSEWASRRQKLLDDKIDVTKFWVWFIDHYPQSAAMIRKPDFDFREFK